MNNPQTSKSIIRRLINRAAILFISLLLAIVAGLIYSSDWEYRFYASRIERIIDRKHEILKENIVFLGEDGIDAVSLRSKEQRVKMDDLQKRGITLLAYYDSSLIFWTDNSFDVPSYPFVEEAEAKLIFIQNGYFLADRIESGDTVIIGLLRVFNSFDIENSLLKNGFPDYFRLPLDASIITPPIPSGYNISDSDGKALFTIQFPDIKENTLFIIIPVILWGLFFLFLLLVIDELALLFVLKNLPGIAILFKALLFGLLYFAIYSGVLPAVLKGTELFLTSVFSIGKVIPSLGHLFILSIFFADLASAGFRYFPRKDQLGENMSALFLRFTGALLPGTIMIILIHQLLLALLSHTNINFEGYKVDELSLLSIVGIGSLFFLFFAAGVYILKIINVHNKLKLLPFLIAAGLNLLIFLDAGLFGISTGWILAIFFILLVSLIRIYSSGRMSLFNLSALFSILVSVYVTVYITKISLENEKESLKVMAVNYATEHDPVAEYLLLDLDEAVKADTVLQKMMRLPTFGNIETAEVSAYLIEKYFGSYWTNYDISMVVCDENSSLRVNQTDIIVSDCFRFFEDRILKEGEEITGTNFHFIDNRSGRPCYMGIYYFDVPGGGSNGVFIELLSFVNAFREGYPELLTDQKYLRSTGTKDYSFAKYMDGALVLNTGDFRYWTSDRDFEGESGSYFNFERDGYYHLLYRTGDTTVILSRPLIPSLNRIVSFAWVFIFMLGCTSVLSMIYHRIPGRAILKFNFRQRLQAAFMVVILLSLIGTASGAIWLSFEQYRSKHYDNLREKARSVNIELEHKLGMESVIENGWNDGNYQSLDELLVKFSNVFYTDINLYDEEGMLLATSRPEMFIRDLTSLRMDKLAHISISQQTENEYIAWGKTGDLNYLSIYLPFFNDKNELLAYLNLPYFSMQTALSAEMSNLIVAVINFSLLLILATMSLAVILSDRITAPIRMIGDVISSVKLGKKSERLNYKADDEIGDLVRHYNSMIEELEESARKLSASEREFAWREMARQIAHEIKNPLTPMKLNIQQLEKSWNDGKPAFGKKLEKFTRNQIEYIDNLSSIATAFSNFARLPNANPVNLDIVGQLKTTLELFRNSGNINFRVSSPASGSVFVNADREQMNSVFSNLIKNSIQAIPSDREGIIKIVIKPERDRVVITISDNGVGIPEEVKSHLFTPYFTTKSSGSGLGLGIVKRFVEGMGGDISFVSETQNGTTFTISLPIIYSIERLK